MKTSTDRLGGEREVKNINWVREGPGYPSLMRGGQEGLPQCQRRESAVGRINLGFNIYINLYHPTMLHQGSSVYIHRDILILIKKIYSVLYEKVSPGSDGKPGQIIGDHLAVLPSNRKLMEVK